MTLDLYWIARAFRACRALWVLGDEVLRCVLPYGHAGPHQSARKR